jgi:hypothetical protein
MDVDSVHIDKSMSTFNNAPQHLTGKVFKGDNSIQVQRTNFSLVSLALAQIACLAIYLLSKPNQDNLNPKVND